MPLRMSGARLPPTGLPLPLVSYGGTSLVVFMAAISQNLGVIEMAISLVVTPLVSTFTRKIDKKYVDDVFLCFNKN